MPIDTGSHGPTVLQDIWWRDRVRKEREIAAKPPPAIDAHSTEIAQLLCLADAGKARALVRPSTAGLRMSMSGVEGGIFGQPPHTPPGRGAGRPAAIKRDESIHFPRRRPVPRAIMSRPASAPMLRGMAMAAEPVPERERELQPEPGPQQQQLLQKQQQRRRQPPPPQPEEEEQYITFQKPQSQRPLGRSTSAAMLNDMASQAGGARPSAAWQRHVYELQLRVELEKLKQKERKTHAELARAQRKEEERRRFVERSGANMAQFRHDLGNTKLKAQRSSVDRIVFGRDIDGSEQFEAIQADFGMKGPGRRRDQRQWVTEVDMVVFGRDQDGSAATEHAFASRGGANAVRDVRRHRDNRQFRSEVDEAIFGHDQDFSQGQESYSRRSVHVPG